LNRAAANAELSSNLQHALAVSQLTLDALFQRRIDPWPAQLLTRCFGPLKPGVDALTDLLRSNSTKAPVI